jgi:hypothetical protein
MMPHLVYWHIIAERPLAWGSVMLVLGGQMRATEAEARKRREVKKYREMRCILTKN